MEGAEAALSQRLSQPQGEAAGEGVLPNLLDTTSFPEHLLVLFCFRRHLSPVFGVKTPDPPQGPTCRNRGRRRRWDRVPGLPACPVCLLILSSSSCASIFIEGKKRKPGGNPRKAEHVVISGVAAGAG